MTAALPTFDEVLSEKKVEARKSDLSNLAHAHVELARHRKKLEADIAKIDSTLAEIVALGNKSDATRDEVSALYTKATGFYRR
jgi:hypothetical protein